MSAPSTRRLLATHPPELVVYDELAQCPYLPDRTSRLPLRLPLRSLTRNELDDRLVRGDRRQGLLLYRTACPDCQGCEPIRLDVDQFRPNRTMRRILRRGDRAIETEIGPLDATEEKVRLYNLHKQGRGLTSGEPELDLDGYRAFLGESCCETFELRYHVDGELIGVAIVDRGTNALSAVYCFFDPAHGNLSPGTFSILKQLALCKRWGLQHLYLGLYIEDAASMAYKARFTPHERRLHGVWKTIDGAPVPDAAAQ